MVVIVVFVASLLVIGVVACLFVYVHVDDEVDVVICCCFFLGLCIVLISFFVCFIFQFVIFGDLFVIVVLVVMSGEQTQQTLNSGQQAPITTINNIHQTATATHNKQQTATTTTAMQQITNNKQSMRDNMRQ